MSSSTTNPRGEVIIFKTTTSTLWRPLVRFIVHFGASVPPDILSGEQGIAYGAPSDGETPSTIYYRPYDSWASQSDWSVSLLPGEDALLIGAGGAASNSMGSVIVASSKGFVRFLSSSGIQRYVWRIGEEMVSLASGEEAVICVHREGGTSLDGEDAYWARDRVDR